MVRRENNGAAPPKQGSHDGLISFAPRRRISRSRCEGVSMNEHRTERRDFLKQVTALGAGGIVAGLRPRFAQAAGAPGESKMIEAWVFH